MSVDFTVAASRDQFVSRLDAMNQGLNKGEYLDETLTPYTSTTACFWMRKVLTPFYGIAKSDAFAPFRAINVASSLFRYCQANKQFLTEELVTTKVVTILDHLNRKNAKPAVDAQKTAIKDILKPAQPEPQPANPAPAPAVPAAPVENKEKPAEKPAEKPKDAPAPVNAATATKVDVVANPASPAAAAAATPAANPAQGLPAASPALVSLTQGEIDLAKRQLTATTNHFAYDVHSSISKAQKRGSFCFSPIALMNTAAMLLKGATDAERSALVKRLSFGHIKFDAVDNQLKAIRDALDDQEIVLRSAYVSGYELKDTTKEFVAKLEGFGAIVAQPTSKPTTSARRNLNKAMSDETGIKDFVVLDDSYTKTKHNLVLDVLSFSPTIAQAPKEKIEKRLFTFQNEKAVKVDFFGYYDVKVLEEGNFKMVVMPYAQAEGQPVLEKVLFIPNKDANLNEFSKKLNANFVKECQAKLSKDGVQKTTVYLPALEISYDRDDLLQRLNEMVSLTLLAGEKLGSCRQHIEFNEEIPDVVPPAAQEGPAKTPLYIDRTFYYFVKSGDDILVQGRVDDDTSLVHQA